MSAGFGCQFLNKRTDKVIANVIPQIASNTSRTGRTFLRQLPRMLSLSLGTYGLNFFDPGQKQTDQSQYRAYFVAQFGKP
jgi:hypothetical protein